MNKYELALVLKPSLEEEAKIAESQKVQDLITRFGGTIEKIDDWGKKKTRLRDQKKLMKDSLALFHLRQRAALLLKLKAVSVSWKMFFVISLSARMQNKEVIK